MKAIYCALPYLLLGAVLAAPLFWWLDQRWRKTRPSNATRNDVILWLTPRCAEALGECAAPGNLRRMSSESIAKRLDRVSFPADEQKPDIAQYSSWPGQAQHLYLGNYEKLRLLQDTLPNQSYKEESESKQTKGYMFGDLLALLLMIILLLSAFVASRLIANHPDWCSIDRPISCNNNVGSKIKTVTIPFDTDLVFDFNRSDPISEEHTLRAKNLLTRLLKQYQSIRFTGLSAQTDPIGSEISNRALADKRANFVRTILGEIIAKDESGIFLDDTISTSVINESVPSLADYKLWNTCFKKFQIDALNKPLEDLPADRNPNNRPLCLQADSDVAEGKPFPACRRLMIPKMHSDDNAIKVPRAEIRSYAMRAENFRELTACLAPMRHVLITFEHTQNREGEK